MDAASPAKQPVFPKSPYMDLFLNEATVVSNGLPGGRIRDLIKSGKKKSPTSTSSSKTKTPPPAAFLEFGNALNDVVDDDANEVEGVDGGVDVIAKLSKRKSHIDPL